MEAACPGAGAEVRQVDGGPGRSATGRPRPATISAAYRRSGRPAGRVSSSRRDASGQCFLVALRMCAAIRAPRAQHRLWKDISRRLLFRYHDSRHSGTTMATHSRRRFAMARGPTGGQRHGGFRAIRARAMSTTSGYEPVRSSYRSPRSACTTFVCSRRRRPGDAQMHADTLRLQPSSCSPDHRRTAPSCPSRWMAASGPAAVLGMLVTIP